MSGNEWHSVVIMSNFGENECKEFCLFKIQEKNKKKSKYDFKKDERIILYR